MILRLARSVESIHVLASFIGLCLLTSSASALAVNTDGFGPLTTRNQNAVYLQTLTLMPQRAEVLPAGMLETRIDSAYSNMFEQGHAPGADLNLDMELWRLGIVAQYGLGQGLQVGLEIPLVHFDGGFLDAFIQDFHKFFGFPNGGRDRVPNNEFHYQFDAAGERRLAFPPTTLGLGDISLHLKGQIAGEDSDWPALAWFADLKFPTGRRSRGLGNGTLDFGFGVALDASWKRLHGYFNAGYYVSGGNAHLDGYQHNEAFAYMIAGEVSIIPSLSVIVQIEGGTPLLTGTGIDAWDGVPLDLIIGFRGEERDLVGPLGDLIWQVGFGEDVSSQGPSVDFTVYASIGVRFDPFSRRRPVGDWLAKRVDVYALRDDAL